jgi:tetratricopeptide (TPR) repeat protein
MRLTMARQSTNLPLIFMAVALLLATHPGFAFQLNNVPPAPAAARPAAPAASSADEQLQQAEAALQKEDYETATPLLEAYLSRRPTDVPARFNLALAYSMTRRAAQAIEQYYKVLAEQPDLVPAHLNLGMMLRYDEKYEEALKHLQIVVGKQPNHWTALTELGRTLAKLKRVPEARAALEKALAIEPGNASPRLDLIELLTATDPPAAERELRALLRDAPPDMADAQEARLQLANLLVARSAPATAVRDEALQLFEDAAKSLPRRVDIRLHLADLLLADKRPAEAIAQIEAARAVGKIPNAANELLLEAYLDSNQKGRAAELLPEMIAADPKNAKLYMALGSLHNEVKNYPEAASLFIKAVELDPNSADGWTNLASSLYLMKEYARALTALDKVATLKADTPGTYFVRALCLDQLGGQQQAYDNYQKFLSTSGGKNPDQQFQAKERSRILERELKRKGGR